ncbi:MAG: peptidoglycan-binding protein [Hyphomicrobiales bacterium]
MTNTFKKIAIAAMAAATMLAGVTSSNASGMNALASFKAETTVATVGFFKKNGKFTNRGVAAVGVGAAVVGGLLAHKTVKHRNNHRARRHYVKPRRHFSKPRRHYAKPRHYYAKPGHYYAKPRHYYAKPRHVAKKRYTPRVYKPVIAFNQNVFNQQTWLNQIGYNAGVADGKMGSNTRTAAMQFQLAYGMPATGYLTAQQTGILAQQAATVLAQGSQPVAPTAYAPQVQYAPAPTTQVFAKPQVQYVPAPQVQYAPAKPAPQVQYVAPAKPAPVQPIAYAPTAQPQVQYAPQAQYVPQVKY